MKISYSLDGRKKKKGKRTPGCLSTSPSLIPQHSALFPQVWVYRPSTILCRIRVFEKSAFKSHSHLCQYTFEHQFGGDQIYGFQPIPGHYANPHFNTHHQGYLLFRVLIFSQMHELLFQPTDHIGTREEREASRIPVGNCSTGREKRSQGDVKGRRRRRPAQPPFAC